MGKLDVSVPDEILETAGITRAWLDEFVEHSNLIDPQPGYDNAPGSPRWDHHIEAALWAINAGNQGELVEPRDVHAILMREFMLDKAGHYRKVDVRVGRWVKPKWIQVPDLMQLWQDHVEKTLDADAIAEEKIDRGTIEGLHCEFENIHPWPDGNGRSGRLIMLNHAIVVGLEPWIIHYGEEQEAYYRMIESHESHARLSKDMMMDMMNDLLAAEFSRRGR